MLSLESISAPELLRPHAATTNELRRRGVVRSSNNPVGDLAEYLFCRAFGWELAPKSAKAADAVCADGKLYQIKSRRITAHNPSRQLGVLRKLDGAHFASHTLVPRKIRVLVDWVAQAFEQQRMAERFAGSLG